MVFIAGGASWLSLVESIPAVILNRNPTNAANWTVTLPQLLFNDRFFRFARAEHMPMPDASYTESRAALVRNLPVSIGFKNWIIQALRIFKHEVPLATLAPLASSAGFVHAHLRLWYLYCSGCCPIVFVRNLDAQSVDNPLYLVLAMPQVRKKDMLPFASFHLLVQYVKIGVACVISNANPFDIEWRQPVQDPIVLQQLAVIRAHDRVDPPALLRSLRLIGRPVDLLQLLKLTYTAQPPEFSTFAAECMKVSGLAFRQVAPDSHGAIIVGHISVWLKCLAMYSTWFLLCYFCSNSAYLIR